MKPPKWSEDEVREILAYLRSEAERSLALPDAPARLGYLRGEAWHVADRVGGELKLDAIAMALEIDRMALRLGVGGRAPGAVSARGPRACLPPRRGPALGDRRRRGRVPGDARGPGR